MTTDTSSAGYTSDTASFFLNVKDHPLKMDIAAQHFFHVAALLAGHQRSGVNLRKDLLRREGLGKQFAAFHPLPHVLQQPAEGLCRAAA